MWELFSAKEGDLLKYSETVQNFRGYSNNNNDSNNNNNNNFNIVWEERSAILQKISQN